MSAVDQDQRTAGTQPALKQLRRRCKMPALILWQAVAEDRPEGTPTEKQDPQRRQHPHHKPHRVDRLTIAAR